MSPGKGKGARYLWLLAHVGHQGDDCLFWPFPPHEGYRSLSYLGVSYSAHRFMCELANGQRPEGYEAAHSCGRGGEGCLNPRHLSWKTRTENERDKFRHGGTAWNAGKAQEKLTAADVAQIRERYPAETVTQLAKAFNVTRSNIRKILKRETWTTGVAGHRGWEPGDPRHPLNAESRKRRSLWEAERGKHG